ncbi:DUF6274 family protein [Streptomyces sp. NPDC049916]|uniref:DUF6274 family protein n=1 Tax=Streptomyces sp. NPDC049916 TaxID=3155156 RepID=UPI00342129C2
MSASAARHETRALLRAHLAAASGYRHLTRRCAVCHRLLRLAMEPGEPEERRERDEADRRGAPSGPFATSQDADRRPNGQTSQDEGDGADGRYKAERPSGP